MTLSPSLIWTTRARPPPGARARKANARARARRDRRRGSRSRRRRSGARASRPTPGRRPSPSGAASGLPSARSLRTMTRRSICGSSLTSVRAIAMAPSRSVARSLSPMPSSAARAAEMSVVAARPTRAGAPARTIAAASPSWSAPQDLARPLLGALEARAAARVDHAHAHRVVEHDRDRDRGARRLSASREHFTSGEAPSSASARIERHGSRRASDLRGARDDVPWAGSAERAASARTDAAPRAGDADGARHTAPPRATAMPSARSVRNVIARPR